MDARDLAIVVGVALGAFAFIAIVVGGCILLVLAFAERE